MRDIQSVIDEVDLLREAKELVYEPLSGGLANWAYKVTTDEMSYVLRINGDQSNLLGLKREDEVDILQKVYEQGISPKIFLTKNRTEYVITEFKQGHTISSEEMHNPEIFLQVVDLLKKAHGIKGITRIFSQFDLVDRYLDGARKLNVVLPDGLDEILRKVDIIRNRSARYEKYTRHFCHNDMYQNNMMNSDDGICIIDWELSGIGDIFFDLATISWMSDPCEHLKEMMLQRYFGGVEPEHHILLRDMLIMNMVREVGFGLMFSGMQMTVNTSSQYYNDGIYFVDKILKEFPTI